jgi:hypothetical protein
MIWVPNVRHSLAIVVMLGKEFTSFPSLFSLSLLPICSFFYFIVLLFICAYKAWVISPLCPHPLPHHPLHPLPLLPTPSIPGTVSNTEHLILKANI